MNTDAEFSRLIQNVVNGETRQAVEEAEKLLSNGLAIESLIHDGLTVALRSLDSKCTNEEFNLLEIMLAGRAMTAVMDKVVLKQLPSHGALVSADKIMVLGTIRGDIHELGKHVVKMLLRANGYKVVDLGKDIAPQAFVKAALMEGAGFIGVSSLITLTIPYIREIRTLLREEGMTDVKVLAGGAAIQQANADDLNVDYVASDAFDALNYLAGLPAKTLEKDAARRMTESMTSYERLLSAVNGKPCDRTPVAPQVFGNAAKLMGHSLREYVSDGRVLAGSQLKVRDAVGYDILFAFADLNIEAEALGCSLKYEDNAYPSIVKHLITGPGEGIDFPMPDPAASGRMPVVLEACTRLREAVGNECIISACVTGPVTIASQLTGIEPFLYQLADSPVEVNSLLDFTENVAIAYGRALLRAGAHCIVIFDPVASPAVLPLSLFVNYEFPRLRRMCGAFRSAGCGCLVDKHSRCNAEDNALFQQGGHQSCDS